jgi:hypothetical protein
MLHEHTPAAESSGKMRATSRCCSPRETEATTSRTTAKTKTGAGIIPYLETYRPLIAIGGVALAGGLLAAFAVHQVNIEGGMHVAMALSLLPLALLKLFDVSGFAASFAKYDPIAQRMPLYARCYPFLEAALGLCFLNGVLMFYANLFVVAMFGANSIGVLTTLRRGDSRICACVGPGFAIPIGRVTLAENIFMCGMAALMLAM